MEELVDEAQKSIFSIGEERVSNEPKPINEVMEATLDLLDKLRHTRGGVTGLATGYPDLDRSSPASTPASSSSSRPGPASGRPPWR